MKTSLTTALWPMGFLVALGGGLGCGDRGSNSGAHAPTASGPASGDVLMVVDSIAVRTGDLRALQAAGALSAREALARLEAEALLMAEAERRGYGARPAVAKVTDQALAQAYVDARASEVTVSAEEIAAAYARETERFHKEERRGFLHVLAPLPQDREPTAAEEAAARSFADEAQAALTAPGADLQQVARGLLGRPLVYKASGVEKAPPMSRDRLVKPFADALFAAAAPGPLPATVRTVFGWHAVVLTELVPAVSVTLEQATPALTAELLAKARGEALTRHLAELREAQRVELAPDYRQRLETPQFDE